MFRPDHPRKICFATIEYPPDIGGVGKSAQRLVCGLAQAGFELCVFKLIKHTHEAIASGPAPIEGGMLYTASRTCIVPVIAYVDKVVNFDLFHGFYLPMAYHCSSIAREGSRPLVASIRGRDGLVFRHPHCLEVLTEAAWITSVSKDSLRRASSVVDISRRSCFIPNSIDMLRLPRWEPTEKNTGVVGTVAHIRRKKNIPLLLDAYSHVNPRLRRELLLVGEFLQQEQSGSSSKDDFERMADTRNLRREITLAGYVPNDLIPQSLLAMGLFVLSSDNEGLPNSILEAAAVGVPIVATAVDGVKDVFTDGVNALLVPPGSTADLTIAIERVLENVEFALRLSRGALELAKTLAPELEVRAFMDVYNRAVALRPKSHQKFRRSSALQPPIQT